MSDKPTLSEKAAALRLTVSEEIGLSKHYETQQYVALTALFAVLSAAVNLRDRIAALGAFPELVALLGIGLAILALAAAAVRACSLSVLSYHAGLTCRDKLCAALRNGSDLDHLLSLNFRDAKVNDLPALVRPLVRPPFTTAAFVYSVIAVPVLGTLLAVILAVTLSHSGQSQ